MRRARLASARRCRWAPFSRRQGRSMPERGPRGRGPGQQAVARSPPPGTPPARRGRSAGRRARSGSRARSSPRSAAARRLGSGTPSSWSSAAWATQASDQRRPARWSPRRSSARRRCAPRRCRTSGAAGRSTRSGCARRSSRSAPGSPRSPRTRPSSPKASGMPQRGKLLVKIWRAHRVEAGVAPVEERASWPRAPAAPAARGRSRSQTRTARSAPADAHVHVDAEGVVAPRHVLEVAPPRGGSARCR